jgi:sigma-B regulation protein RsbU (phosphoserine phosphatase)
MHAAELRSFIDNMVDGVSLLDAHGGTVLLNDAGRYILGCEPGQAPDERVLEGQRYTLDGIQLASEETPARRALRGEVVRDFRYKIVVPNRSEIILSASASPVCDSRGSVVGATNVFSDISERIEFERQRDELYEREHHIAEMLQMSIIPPEVPSEIGDHRIAVKYIPALLEAEVGGDFYDVFELDEGRFGILIGDVVGKGLQSAIRVAEARHVIRSYAYLDPRPSRVMALANDVLCKAAREDTRMLTAFYAVVDPGLEGITYASAGHVPPVVCTADGLCDCLDVGGVALGVLPGIPYQQGSRRINTGDTIVLVTDGITEARTVGSNLFGMGRMTECIMNHRTESPDRIASELLLAAVSHANGRLQDDVAIMIIRRQLPFA